jgi:hypothetical protein
MSAVFIKRRELCSAHEAAKPVWLVWLPHVLVACWLLYLGVSIWQHVLNSVQPPLYDPLGYIQKAMHFWQALERGELFNPLNLEPMARPPGTILMSYPFGFTPDFHGFHFRSVFLPILCMVAAVYIVAGVVRESASGWWVAAIALLCSSLPMFYHFDWVEGLNSTTRWGLVDNFQAGIAAMGTAATVRSLMTRSWPWLSFGALLAAFTLFIKPSGLMIMALMGLIWIMFVAVEWFRASKHKPDDHSLRAYVFKGGPSILIIYICITSLCVFSGYLSKSNFAYAQQALNVMREVLQLPFQQNLLLFHHSVGVALPLWVLGVGVLFMYRFLTVRDDDGPLPVGVLGLLVGSLFVWSSGMWYWLVVQAGGSQIRYFYPFMLMGVVCMIPAALNIWPQVNRLIRKILMVICLLPALNIGGLLAAGDSPSITWQKIAGVSISVGTDREVVRQAYTFLHELRKAKKDAEVYSFSNGVPSFIFENVGMYEKIVHPELSVFHLVIPQDWVRGFAVRVDEILSCDYILIRKVEGSDAGGLSAVKKLDSFATESLAFEIWLATLNEQSGVETVSDGLVLRLLHIVDRNALHHAIDTFVSARSWRPEFLAANRPVWWNAETVKAAYGKPAAEDVGFGGVYKLHALAIKRVEQGIKIDVWWEELHHEEANNQRYLFFHLVDQSGKIIYNQQIALFPYKPLDAEKRWRHGEVEFNEAPSDVHRLSLAFGIYQPNGPFLLSDKKMPTDWEGRRVLVPLSAISDIVRK